MNKLQFPRRKAERFNKAKPNNGKLRKRPFIPPAGNGGFPPILNDNGRSNTPGTTVKEKRPPAGAALVLGRLRDRSFEVEWPSIVPVLDQLSLPLQLQ
jgi:hypothetical protein